VNQTIGARAATGAHQRAGSVVSSTRGAPLAARHAAAHLAATRWRTDQSIDVIDNLITHAPLMFARHVVVAHTPYLRAWLALSSSRHHQRRISPYGAHVGGVARRHIMYGVRYVCIIYRVSCMCIIWRYQYKIRKLGGVASRQLAESAQRESISVSSAHQRRRRRNIMAWRRQ